MQLQAFPIYSSISEQFRYNPKLQGFANYYLYAPKTSLLPFLLRKPSDQVLLDCVRIMYPDNTEYAILEASALQYQLFSNKQFDYIFYYGSPIEGLNMPCGQYYLELLLGTFKYYSEVFTVHNNLDKLLKLQYFSDTTIGYLTYQTGWKQELYFDSELTEPEYPTNIEDAKNGFDISVLTFGKVSKVVRIKQSDILPEYLIDALSIVPLHNHVTIGEYGEVDEVTVKPTWVIDGVLGTVEMEFAESQVLLTGCNEINGLVEVDTSGHVNYNPECGAEPTTEPIWQNTGNIRCQQIEVRETAWRAMESSAYCQTN